MVLDILTILERLGEAQVSGISLSICSTKRHWMQKWAAGHASTCWHPPPSFSGARLRTGGTSEVILHVLDGRNWQPCQSWHPCSKAKESSGGAWLSGHALMQYRSHFWGVWPTAESSSALCRGSPEQGKPQGGVEMWALAEPLHPLPLHCRGQVVQQGQQLAGSVVQLWVKTPH